MQLRGKSEQERHSSCELQYYWNLQDCWSITEWTRCEKGESCRVPERNGPVGEPQEWTHQYCRPVGSYSIPSGNRLANSSSENRYYNNGRERTVQHRPSPLRHGP